MIFLPNPQPSCLNSAPRPTVNDLTTQHIEHAPHQNSISISEPESVDNNPSPQPSPNIHLPDPAPQQIMTTASTTSNDSSDSSDAGTTPTLSSSQSPLTQPPINRIITRS